MKKGLSLILVIASLIALSNINAEASLPICVRAFL